MTEEQKQKEYLVTIRSIIANTNSIQEISDNLDELCTMAKYVVDNAEDFYPEKKEVEKPNFFDAFRNREKEANISLYLKLDELLDKDETTKTSMHNCLVKKGIGNVEAWEIINKAIDTGILVRTSNSKVKLVNPGVPF